MAKHNTLYEVHAGKKGEVKCPVVYETTKESKAYDYIRELEKSDTDYEKIYITKRPLSRADKRDMWDD